MTTFFSTFRHFRPLVCGAVISGATIRLDLASCDQACSSPAPGLDHPVSPTTAQNAQPGPSPGHSNSHHKYAESNSKLRSWFSWPFRRKAPKEDPFSRYHRSRRSQMLMSDIEVRYVAELINKFVDLEGFTEQQEQEIFEFSVWQIIENMSAFLPDTYLKLAHSDVKLPKQVADELEDRLTHWLWNELKMPYLDEQDKRRVIHCTLVMLTRSMRKQNSMVGDLSKIEQDKLVMDVFVKGAIDLLYNPKQRTAIIDELLQTLESLPLFSVIKPVARTLLNYQLNFHAKELSDVLIETFEQVMSLDPEARARLPMLPPALPPMPEEEARERCQKQPFGSVMRYNLMMDILRKNHLGFSGLVPEYYRALLVKAIVDAMLTIIHCEKLEVICREKDATRLGYSTAEPTKVT